MVRGQLGLLRALAEDNEREQQLGSLNAYAYPQSLGDWLGNRGAARGVGQLAGALRAAVATHADHGRGIAEQGRGMIELYGAVLIGALGACDTALEREVSPELEVELPEVESALEVSDEAREERTAWCSRTGRSARRSGSTAPAGTETPRCYRPATKLLEAAGFAALALAVADEA